MSSTPLDVEKFKRRYRRYYILKTTAWITPIFFLFLKEQIGIGTAEVLKISGLLMALPILLDTPLGILSDRFGAKTLLTSGSLLQLASLLGFFVLPGPWSYFSYLVSIVVAENCYSGAEQSFLSENIKNPEEIRAYLRDLNKSFYFWTIPALIGGILLYQLHPYLPLFAQAISFAMAVLFIWKFPAAHPQENSNAHDTFSIKDSVGFVLSYKSVLGVLLISTIFATVVQINAKTIQGQLSHLSQDHLFFWLGLSYAMGNLASSFSLAIWSRSPLHKMSFRTQFIVLFFFLFLTQVSTAFSSAWVLCLGFLVLNGIKSVYRPLISGELITRFRSFPNLATHLSILSTLTTLMVGALHMLNAQLLIKFDLGNFPLSVILTIVFLFALLLFANESTCWKRLHKPSFSGKLNFIGLHQGQKSIKHIYPSSDDIPSWSQVKKIAEHLDVRIPIVRNQNGKILIVSYIDGLTLAEIGTTEINKHLEALLKKYKKAVASPQNEHQDSISNYRLGDEFLEYLDQHDKAHLIQGLLQPEYLGKVHGDLNPHNIIIDDNDSFIHLIDWDLCGWGYYWFDILSIVTHPDLSLSFEQRFELIRNFLSSLTARDCRDVIINFCLFKRQALAQMNNHRLVETSFAYLQLSKDSNGTASA